MENTLKQPLNLKDKITAIIIVILELAIIIKVGYSLSYDHYNNAGWNFVMILFFIPGLFISIPGIIIGQSFLRKKRFSFISLLLLIISVCSFPLIGYPISNSIVSKILAPIALSNYNKTEIKSSTAYELKKKSLYESLSRNFQYPKKVLYVDDYIFVLILEDGYIIKPMDITDNKRRADFFLWAKKNLINKEIQIKLPLIEKGKYSQFYVLPCNAGSGAGVDYLIKKYTIPENSERICSTLEVQIYFKGQLINEMF
jgi:hypothetical protein